MQDEILFEELQKPRQWQIQLLVIMYFLYLTYVTVKQVFFYIPLEFITVPNWALILFWLFFGVFIPAMYFCARMHTKVDQSGLYIFYYPFHRSFKPISLEGLKEIKVRKYSPIAEYGGWGIRFGKEGNAFNAYGDEGVELIFEEKRNLLIGSQRAQELYEAIEKITKESNYE